MKEAICYKLNKENGLAYHPDEVIVSCGAKHSLFNAILTLCDTDDEVLLPVPFWVTYVEQIRLAGGKPVFIHCDPKTLRISWEDILSKITNKTKLFILNNPSNPSGIVWDIEILKMCIRDRLRSDELPVGRVTGEIVEGVFVVEGDGVTTVELVSVEIPKS